MLGGVSNPPLRSYASSLWFRPVGDATAHYGDGLRQARERGFTAVKAKLGRFPYPTEPLLATLREEHFHELPITAAHGIEAGMLPLHHRDPFDRIMIAQARMERLTLVTADRLLAAYEVDLLLT